MRECQCSNCKAARRSDWDDLTAGDILGAVSILVLGIVWFVLLVQL